jgi:kanamycin kinase
MRRNSVCRAAAMAETMRVTKPVALVPEAVALAAGSRDLALVWTNRYSGGLTFTFGEGDGRCFVKWVPAASGIDLAGEAERMGWAGQFHPVPRPLDQGRDAEGSWLVTSALPGEMACSDRWKTEPAVAVTAIGEGLRALHEALSAADCPFSWSAEDRVADARRRAAAGTLDPSTEWHYCHQSLSIAVALKQAAAVPPVDRLVVCHGDACAPNTLLGADGRWSGHVDLGRLGIADRWADLAVATWSAEWNYGPGWDNLLLDAYGVRPDPDRTRFYRLLYDLS